MEAQNKELTWIVAILSVMMTHCNSWNQNRSKEGSIIKNHALCDGEETNNYEAKLARETTNEKVMMEEEVDPFIKKEKHKENRVKNMS